MKITVIIPCHNEARSIAKVINGFPKDKLGKLGHELDILVIDNNSTDTTIRRARNAGARVIKESKQGKGHAIKTGFGNLKSDTDIVVMIDGDNSYRSNEILRMIEPLESGFCDVVMGSRLTGKMHDGSMNKINRGGNWVYTHLVRLFYPGVNVTDVLTGYYAWRREIIDELAPYLQSSGFSIEMEMITKMPKMGFQVYSVPISYHPRTGRTHLKPFKDGLHILWAFGHGLRWQPTKALEVSESED